MGSRYRNAIVCSWKLRKRDLPIGVQKRSTQNVLQEAGVFGRQGWPFGRPAGFWKKRHRNMGRGRVIAPVDLEPPEGLALGFGRRLGLGIGFGLVDRCEMLKWTTHVLNNCFRRPCLHTAGAGKRTTRCRSSISVVRLFCGYSLYLEFCAAHTTSTHSVWASVLLIRPVL